MAEVIHEEAEHIIRHFFNQSIYGHFQIVALTWNQEQLYGDVWLDRMGGQYFRVHISAESKINRIEKIEKLPGEVEWVSAIWEDVSMFLKRRYQISRGRFRGDNG